MSSPAQMEGSRAPVALLHTILNAALCLPYGAPVCRGCVSSCLDALILVKAHNCRDRAAGGSLSCGLQRSLCKVGGENAES